MLRKSLLVLGLALLFCQSIFCFESLLLSKTLAAPQTSKFISSNNSFGILIDRIVAIVGDKCLTSYELEKLCQPFYKRLEKQNIPEEEKNRLKKEIQKNVLENWIENVLIEEECKKWGITVSDKEVETALKRQIEKFGGYNKFLEFLKAQGLTLEDYKKNLKLFILKSKFFNLITHQKIVITEEELKKAYKEFLKKFDRTPKFLVSLIITHNNATAQKVYNLLLSGKKATQICALFKKQVNCEENVILKKSEISPELYNLLLKAYNSTSKVTKPILNNQMYIIVQVKSFNPGIPPSYEKVKIALYQKLFIKKSKTFLKHYIQRLKKENFIKILL